MNIKELPIVLAVSILFFNCFNCVSALSQFEKFSDEKQWKLQFADSCTSNWENQWFLDGKLATITHTDKGMNFEAGPENRNDAHHAVLWTKDSFEGDIKIEYEYTRTDEQIVNVNILYIQATGIGVEPYVEDISKWKELREVPSMSKYFKYMKALHISYAAFDMNNKDPKSDYVRVRKYPVTKAITFAQTEVPPSYDFTSLFKPYETYHITVIKVNSKLFFKVDGAGVNEIFEWKLEDKNPITGGRVGLRHMFTRSATYRNFNIYTRR